MSRRRIGWQLFYLLRPREAEFKFTHLMAEEVVTIQEQGIWIPAKLVSICAEGQHKGKWEYVNTSRGSKEGDSNKGWVLDKADTN